MSERPVVSNTTPLINLAGLDLLPVLPDLYGDVIVPRAVVAEYQAKSAASDPVLASLTWLRIVDIGTVHAGLPALGAGETEAISLALELPARLILLDERKARRIAAQEGLVVVGTLAVLLRAKQRGLIGVIAPYRQSMQAQGRYLGDALIARILHDAGED